MKLSNNFTDKELVVTETGLPNIAREKDKVFGLLLAVFILQVIRDEYGRIKVDSWFRSPTVNREVGGSSTSQHLKGQAADIIPREADLVFVFKWIVEKSGIHFGQCIIYPSKGFIHISLPRIYKPNQQALICHEGDYLPYSEEKLNEITGG